MTDRILLRSGEWEACVLPDFGANTISLRKGVRRILRTPETPEQLAASPFLYGTPLLLPPNRTRDGVFRFEGKEYRLPVNEPETNCHLHGRFADAPFRVIAKSECSCTCRLDNPPEGIDSRFPFAFSIEITHRLDSSGLTQETQIMNLGETAMPLLLGFHTAFCRPARFSVPLASRWPRDCRYLPIGAPVPLSDAELEWTRGAAPDLPVTGYFTAAGGAARIDDLFFLTSANYTQWVLFGGGANDFLCIEPLSGPVNGLNLPGGCIRLPAGKSERFFWRIGSENAAIF